VSATLFISDLHLSDERPAITALFLDFLRERAAGAAALYILGDLFEVWLGDDAVPPGYAPVLEGLQRLAGGGVPVYVMHGNRDFLLGGQFAHQSGCRLLPDPTVIDLDGEPTLLMHGDTLCTDDLEYQQFRARVRNPETQRQFLSLPPAQRQVVARQYRSESRERSRLKSEAIMDVNQGAVEAVLRRHGVQRLIHGHTHRPAVHRFELDGREAQRLVLGDWYQQGSVLICGGEGCRLEALSR
jgi:UDP-2,3-diacylglucosamine hydrolase